MLRKALVTGALAMALVQAAAAQPGGGPPDMPPGGQGRSMRGGPMMMGMGLEQDWMLLCFDLKVPLETLGKLRPAFQSGWEARRELFQDMQNGELDREQMMAEMGAIQEDLQKAYAQHLTEEQRAALEAARQRFRPDAGRRSNRGARGEGDHSRQTEPR